MSNSRKVRDGGPKVATFPWVSVAAGLVVVVVLGLVIAVARGGDGGPADPDQPAFGPVDVSGAPLPGFEPGGRDPAVGMAAPLVEGRTPAGTGIAIGGGGDPALVVFVAHWCPHCQAEVPRIVELDQAGELDGVRVVAVATGTRRSAPNFPPVAWLEREEWPGEILLDDDQFTAAAAYGLAGYPFLVAIDAAGEVVARSSGESAPDDIVALAAQARGA